MPLRALFLISLAAACALAACAPSEPQLMRFSQAGSGPDEFLIVPGKPLEDPPTAALPAPTPGGANRADPTPKADAVAALGGNPAALNRQGIPASDGTLLAYSGRYGDQPGIRQTLAQEDYEYRRSHPGKPLYRVFGLNTYYDAYEPEALNQQETAASWRAAGAETPASPPPELAPD